MTVTSGFFNSLDGDRTYNAEQMSRYFDKIIGSGVIPVPADALQVLAGSGMTIQIMAGRGFVDCHWLDNDSVEVLQLNAAEATLNRVDAVIMKLDLNESVRAVTLEIKEGTPALNPSAPEMERSEYVKEYCLAEIYVATQAEVITQSNITDTRANSNVCGWVTSLIDQVDTSTLFVQWQDAYSSYYDTMTTAFEDWFNTKQGDFADWYTQLTEDLSVGAYIEKYQRTETLTDAVTELAVGIDEYAPDYADELVVSVNGLMLVDGIDYTVSGSGAEGVITFTNDILSGNTVNIIVRHGILGTKQLVDVNYV